MSKFIHFVFFISFSLSSNAQNRDTILNMVLSKPFFYNVIKGEDEKIYAGTADGIVRIDDSKLFHFSSDKGYITLGKDGKPVLNPEGIKNYKEIKYKYLLPFPDQAIDEYHAGANKSFYICSGGRLYIYDIVPYHYSYPNHSIRSISEHFVGTYSGIYRNGIRQPSPVPKFTDGYIREYDGKGYICYDWIGIIDSTAINSEKFIDSSNYSLLKYTGFSQYRDIIKSTRRDSIFYFLSTTDGLQKMNKKDSVTTILYQSKNKKGEVNLIGHLHNSLIFSDASYLLYLHEKDNNKIDTITKLVDIIIDGISFDNRNIYLLTSKGLYLFSSDNNLQLLTELNKAHTLENISNTELVIATDNGLFIFNTVDHSLNPLIQGVEFNRRALFIKDNKLFAGSINGLYTINVNDFDELIIRNKTDLRKEILPFFMIIILLIIGLITLLLVILLMKTRKKLTTAKIQIKELSIAEPELGREQIELFIRENLANASLKSITAHFNISNRNIYKIIEPEKPGSIIQKIRLEMVKEMNNAGRDITEIAEATGLSESYIRKIRGSV